MKISIALCALVHCAGVTLQSTKSAEQLELFRIVLLGFVESVNCPIQK